MVDNFLSDFYPLFCELELHFFQPSSKMSSSNIDLKSNWNGKTISPPYNWIILINLLSHPWALSALRIFIIIEISFSLIVEQFKHISVLYLNFGNVLAFLTGVH